jgi:hypothetical protein
MTTGQLRCPRCGVFSEILSMHILSRGVFRCAGCGRNNSFCVYSYHDRDNLLAEVWGNTDTEPPKGFERSGIGVYMYTPAMNARKDIVESFLGSLNAGPSMWRDGRGKRNRQPLVMDVIKDGYTSEISRRTDVVILENRIGSEVFNYGLPSAYFEDCAMRMCSVVVTVYPVTTQNKGLFQTYHHASKSLGAMDFTQKEIGWFEERLKSIPETNKYYIGVRT